MRDNSRSRAVSAHYPQPALTRWAPSPSLLFLCSVGATLQLSPTRTAGIFRSLSNELDGFPRLLVQFFSHAAQIRRLFAHLGQGIQQLLKASDPVIVRAHIATQKMQVVCREP